MYFNLYCRTISECIPQDVGLYAFADDHVIHKEFEPNMQSQNSAYSELQKTLLNIHNWMNENRLKINVAKTEFMLIATSRNLSKIHKHHEIDVVGEAVKPSDTLWYLGSFLDPVLSFKEFIKRKCTIANWNFLRIKHIRNYLTVDVAKTIVDAMVTSHLDYANDLLIGISNTELKKVQRIQNKAAKILLKKEEI